MTCLLSPKAPFTRLVFPWIRHKSDGLSSISSDVNSFDSSETKFSPLTTFSEEEEMMRDMGTILHSFKKNSGGVF